MTPTLRNALIAVAVVVALLLGGPVAVSAVCTALTGDATCGVLNPAPPVEDIDTDAGE